MQCDSIVVKCVYLSAQRKRSNYSKPSNYWSNIWVTIWLCVYILNSNSVRGSMESMMQDLETLAITFPGCYSNGDQYYKHAQKRLPPGKRNLMLKSEIYKMTNPMFNDTLTFYFQDFTKSTSEPFRSGFYSFSLETKMNVIRMKTLKLPNSVYIVGAYKKAVNFTLTNDITEQVIEHTGATNHSLRTYSACDMFWKRLGDATFVGITGPLCLGSLGADQVRIGVSMTLTKGRLLLTESWYKLSDGTQITEVNVPYILQKLKMPDTSKQFPQNFGISISERMSNDIDTEDDTTNLFKSTRPWSNDDYDHASLKFNKKKKIKKSQNRRRPVQHRILRSFGQVASALTSGHDVYFRVELSACSIPDQVKFERLSFGGRIKNFVYVRQEVFRNERKDYIYFLSHKTVMGSQGPEFISRQLTLLREGRVKVEIIKTFSEPSQVKQGYAFECKLYNDQKGSLKASSNSSREDDDKLGYGGVKLAMDPTSHVKSINNFSSLAMAVDQGRDLHIVADLARCHGSRRKPLVVMGSQIANYDFVNDGKTVEIFIPFVQQVKSVHGDESTQAQGFGGQILKNGDVILTLISNSQSNHSLDNVFHLSSAYHCTLSNRNSATTNNDNEHSIKLFYTK